MTLKILKKTVFLVLVFFNSHALADFSMNLKLYLSGSEAIPVESIVQEILSVESESEAETLLKLSDKILQDLTADRVSDRAQLEALSQRMRVLEQELNIGIEELRFQNSTTLGFSGAFTAILFAGLANRFVHLIGKLARVKPSSDQLNKIIATASGGGVGFIYGFSKNPLTEKTYDQDQMLKDLRDRYQGISNSSNAKVKEALDKLQ